MNLVYYSQEDKRWANQPYSITGDKAQTIGTSACGPTCFAMVASSLTDKMVLPPEAAKFAIDKQFRTINNGTAWGYFAATAKEYGLQCKQVGKLAEAKDALSRGALVIASMGKGEFTGGGHYILLVGVRDGWIDVYDPNHDNRKYGSGVDHGAVRDDGKVSAKESVFIREARQYWIFEREDFVVLKVEDANKIIDLLGAVWKITDTPAPTNEGQLEVQRLANELRKASGQPTK